MPSRVACALLTILAALLAPSVARPTSPGGTIAPNLPKHAAQREGKPDWRVSRVSSTPGGPWRKARRSLAQRPRATKLPRFRAPTFPRAPEYARRQVVEVHPMPSRGMDGKERRLVEDEKEWTVMVYMIADNDLECFGMEDLSEMMDSMR